MNLNFRDPKEYLQNDFWHYFYLNVSSELIERNDKNDGLIITDPEHALIKMGDDLKLGNVS